VYSLNPTFTKSDFGNLLRMSIERITDTGNNKSTRSGIKGIQIG